MTNSKTKQFLKLAEEHKKNKKVDKFSGTLADYLDLLAKDKGLSILAHKRLYNSFT